MRSPLHNRQIWVMAAFGVASGLPLPLSGFTLRQWLSENGTTLAAIGFTANIGLSYSLKFLWAPLLDQVRPPWLGRRRGWLLVIQPLLVAACLLLATSDPATSPARLVIAAIVVAFVSASQDIVVDAWRVETFEERMQGAALAAYIWGYRAALLIAGPGTFALVQLFGWHVALSIMAALCGIGIAATLTAHEPALPAALHELRGLGARFRVAVVDPFRDFMTRPGAAPILAFVMLFKLGEAIAHTMAVPFYNSLGYDRVAIAGATGIPGLIASLMGAAAGAWLIARIGTGRALIATGVVQMASMTLYFLLAVSHGLWWVLVAKITLENVAEGMADVAFITYLSSLCSVRFTATQYALLSSLSAVGLRTLAGFSGVLAGAMGWVGFYALTIFAALPAMTIMLWLLRRYPAPGETGSNLVGVQEARR